MKNNVKPLQTIKTLGELVWKPIKQTIQTLQN